MTNTENKQPKRKRNGETLLTGYINKNNQKNLECLNKPGNHYNQKAYLLKCNDCGYEYEANGCDIAIRKCPKCNISLSSKNRMDINKLDKFSTWMGENTRLAESSIYKYTRAVNTISNEMMEQNILSKSLLDMNLVEIDIAMLNIFQNDYFKRKNSVGNNMYSNALKQFRYFTLDCFEDTYEESVIVKEINDSDELKDIEKQAIIKARIGQGKYRNELIKKYDGKCVITGIDTNKLLIASHIKPWSISDNRERIDVENGLLLSSNMDRLFDSGLITFNDSGLMYISSFVGKANEERLHISSGIKVDLRASKKMLAYLEYHRDVLFVK